MWLAVAALIGLYLVAFAVSTLVRLGQPTEFVYGEAVVLAQVRRLDLGQALYPPTNALPLSITAYPPIYYWVVALLQRLTHDQTYFVGRLVSVAASLGSAACLAVGVRAVSGRWWGGLLAAGLFVTQNLTVLLWAPVHRVDALALCFTLAGLALSSAAEWPVPSAIALVLGVLTKQTYLAGFPSVAVQLWPRRRGLLLFLLTVAVGLSGALLIGQVLSGGWLLWHTVLANANPLELDYFSAMFNSFVELNAVPVIVAAAFLATPALPRERQWRTYFVLSGIETLLTIGKLGASSNYWLELSAATSALLGIHAVRLHATDRRASARLAAITLAALLICVPGYSATVTQAWQMSVADPSPELQLAEMLRDEPGEVLTDQPDLAVLAGKPVEFEFVIFTILAAQHVWDERPILEAIAAHRFGLVVLSQPVDAPEPPLIAARWSPAVRNALLAHYVLVGQQAGYWLYRPPAA